MKLKILLLLAALLLLFCLSHPAISGQGCGSNWMGDTSGDTDFYVSKNQNLGATSSITEPAPTASVSQPIKIGQSPKAVQTSIISSLTPGKPSPQAPGAAITWTASADQSNLLYKFLLKGPSTEGQLIEKTGWTTSSVWVWNTTEVDIGDNQVEVRVRDGKHAGPESYDDHKNASFTIASETLQSVDSPSTQASTSANPHPAARTASTKKTKPRTAPDERHTPLPQNGNPNGPNMSMPDPSPKPLKSATSEDQIAADTSDTSPAETVVAPEPEPLEPESEDIGGKWLVQLDNSGESMELILIQTGGTIMGSGSLLGDSDTKIPLIASGSLASDKLKLDVKTVIGKYVNKIDKQYDMDLKLVDRTLSGSYKAYSGETSTGKGKVVATRPGA